MRDLYVSIYVLCSLDAPWAERQTEYALMHVDIRKKYFFYFHQPGATPNWQSAVFMKLGYSVVHTQMNI